MDGILLLRGGSNLSLSFGINSIDDRKTVFFKKCLPNSLIPKFIRIYFFYVEVLRFNQKFMK